MQRCEPLSSITRGLVLQGSYTSLKSSCGPVSNNWAADLLRVVPVNYEKHTVPKKKNYEGVQRNRIV